MKEWNAKGIKPRDWQKNKVIFFDQDGKPQAVTNDRYQKMMAKKLEDDQKFASDCYLINKS